MKLYNGEIFNFFQQQHSIPAKNLSLIDSPPFESRHMDLDTDLKPQWLWIILVAMPISCIIGNTLVIAAVLSNKSLQTPTNYLLVSLACADLMVGTLVTPFYIYMTINAIHWHLPAITCYIYCVLDVLASTCSIIHLLLISMDRLVAATKPAEYKTHKHKQRVYLAIAFCWLFSVSLALPLVFGSNAETNRFLVEKHHCGIYNPTYMFGSSIFAFFLPLLFMSIIYGYIFYTLKRRLRSIQLQEMAGGQFLGFGADIGNIATSAMETVIGVSQKNRNMITWEKPLLKKIEETAAEHASSLNESEREQLQNILQAASSSGAGSNSNNRSGSGDSSSPNHFNHHSREDSISSSINNIEADDSSSQCHALSIVLDAITVPQPHSSNATQKERDNRFLIDNNFLGVPKIPRRRHSECVDRKMSTINLLGPIDVLRKQQLNRQQRRHSFQSPQERRRRSTTISAANLLGPDSKDNKKMRRLSELITGWERPSRTSLSHMLQFARRDSVYIARKKLAGLKDWALDLIAKLRSKQGMAIRREARATKLVATVMGVFLICWAPYFSMNLYKIYKLYSGGWVHDTEYIFHWLSALGYLNSSLNFIIYSAINKKFRTTFWRLLGFKKVYKRKSWMLPPKGKATNVLSVHKNNNHQKAHFKQQRKRSEKMTVANGGVDTISIVSTIDGGTGTKAAAVECPMSSLHSPRNSKRAKDKKRNNNGKRVEADKSNNAEEIETSAAGGEGAKRKRNRRSLVTSLIPLTRHLSIRKPQIIIEDMANDSSSNNRNSGISITAGGETTYRRTSEDCIQRSASEVFGGGIIFPSGNHHNSRRGSAMSNSSASLQLHDIHQIEAQSAEEMAQVEIRSELFV